MLLLDLTLPTPAENLALDEALLDFVEADVSGVEVLRIWEATSSFVVVGRASRVADEVSVAVCEADQVPILRRCSGGTSVVAGPGCLMYAVVLDCRTRPELRMISEAHTVVLDTIAGALQTLVPDVKRLGTSDLVLGPHKFSGNSLRCKRDAVLYHGTVLYDFPLDTIQRWLGKPPRQPEYRKGRSHRDFIRNFPSSSAAIRTAIANAWHAHALLPNWPSQATADLVQQRYADEGWHRRL